MRSIALLLVVGLIPGLAAAEDPPEVGAPAPEGRGTLEIPGSVWDAAVAGLGRSPGPLGYTSDQMANYSGRTHLLRTVENLFRDARTLPRMSGRLATTLVAKAAETEEVVRIAYSLTDAVAGRRLPLGKHGDADLRCPRGGDEAAWDLLPAAERRLLLRLIEAAVDGSRHLSIAYRDVEALEMYRSVPGVLYEVATAPLTEERYGQLVCTRPESFAALEQIDRERLAFGSVLLLARVRQALDEYRAAEKAPVPEEFPGFALDTALGKIRVYGAGADAIEEPAAIALDVGGDDRWIGRHGVPVAPGGAFPIGIAIDLAGDDTWDSGEEKVALGCGLFGVGLLLDLQGDDTYRTAESGLGCGWFGTGVLVDFAGNDRYETRTHWGQGVGYAGVGALIDLAGNDEYVIGYDGQGYGATLGTGLLLDVSGDDSYLARDDGNISELYRGQSVSMAQGVGQGRRADLGDGHSLAGGFGVLVDGAGDDDYHATCWSHGAGYWWAVGILEDLGGNDTYRDGKYSLGAGAHFAIGICTDLEGDDAYNLGYEEAVNQYQGHARDGSIGVFTDGDGNDRYQLRAHCGGSGDLASIGLFWDRRGDDEYRITATKMGEGGDWGGTPPLGTTTVYGPMRSYRDDLDAIGLFLDTGGRDRYVGESGAWGNDREWPSRRGPHARGYGRDVRHFADRGE